MVEAAVPVIQCNMGIVQSWDTHVDHFPRLKNELLPQTDRGVSALLDDLVDRGLLDSTLVIVVGEFGRTPTISPLANQKVPGRHHWAHGYTAVFAGAGVSGGQVIGKTDQTGGYPVTVPWSPSDIGATVYSSLGIDPNSEVHDRSDRPYRLNGGRVMDVLYS
jgi:arylsulfatase A-like enzyme